MRGHTKLREGCGRSSQAETMCFQPMAAMAKIVSLYRFLPMPLLFQTKMLKKENHEEHEEHEFPKQGFLIDFYVMKGKNGLKSFNL